MIHKQETAGEIVFPSDPKKGDIFITPDGKAFMWDGDSWEVYQLPPEWSQIRNKPDTFPPSIATRDKVGGIKPGRNVTVDYDGTLNATGGGSSDWNDITNKPDEFPPVVATYARVGGVKPGRNINIEPDGTITAAGGGGAEGIIDWPRLPPEVFAPNFALLGMSQGGEDVAMTTEQMLGGVFNNPVNQKVVDQFGNFYQIFPGKDGACFAIQVMKVNVDPAELNKSTGVIVNLLLPLLGDKYLDAWQANATLEPTSVGSTVTGGWSVSISLDKARDKIKLQATQTSTIKPIPIRIMVTGFVKQPVYPTPMPLPPMVTRAVPMNGGFRLFFKPQEGTLLETVQSWGFENHDDTQWNISEVDYSYRFIQIGVDDEYEPDDVGFFNSAWRKRFGAENLKTGRYVNGKKYAWMPYALNQKSQMSPYGQTVTLAPSEKAPLHSPNVLRWEKQDRAYTVHFTLPEGVAFEDVKTVTYYALFYDDSLPKPYLKSVGVGATGQAKFRKDGDEIVATFPEAYKKEGWKSYFWLSFENEAGSSPESIYLFDPPLYPIIYGPTITQVEAYPQGIYVEWTNKDPNEEVFWTRCTLSRGDTVWEEETLYGNPGKWDTKFTPPLDKGEYTLRIEQYGYNFYNHAGDSREIAVYDKGELPPPYIERVLPTLGGVKVHYRPSTFVDPEQYESYYAEIKNLKTGATTTYLADTWERSFDVDGIDDGGIPFYMPLLGKALNENEVQLDDNAEYTIALAGFSKGSVKGLLTTPKYFRTNPKAPRNRPIVSYWKFDAAKAQLDLELYIHTLQNEHVLGLYATVFTYTGTADDPEELFTQQITVVPFREDVESYWAKLNLDQWQEGRNWLVVFDFTNENGTSGYSWPISSDDTVDPEPAPPEKPTITNITYTATSITVEWKSNSADPDKQDWYGYGVVIKDQNNNTVFTDRTSANGNPFVWKTATPIPGGTYLVYVDALGFDYNASTVKTVVIPSTDGPKPPKFDYVMSPQPWQLAAAWATDEPRIEKIALYYKSVASGGETTVNLGPTDRKWTSPDPVKSPPGLWPGDYEVSIELWRDGLSSGRSAAVPVTVKNYDLTPPKMTKLTAQPGYKLLVEWQVMATADYVEIVVQGGGTISQRVKMPAGSTVIQLKGPGSYTVFGRNDYKQQLGPWGNSLNISVQQET